MTGRARASTADALALSEPQAGRAELHALTQSASGRGATAPRVYVRALVPLTSRQVIAF